MTDRTDLQRMTMNELTEEAYRVGITDVQDKSISTLIEAIERRWSFDGQQPEDERQSTENMSMPGGWENFPG